MRAKLRRILFSTVFTGPTLARVAVAADLRARFPK